MLHLHRQIQEYENSEIPYQDFNEDIMDNIAEIRQGMAFPYKINDGMVCRFILSHMNEFDNNDMKGLYLALHEAVKCQASNNAKVIAWKLTRLFVKTLSKKQYYDIWPGFICVCKEESNTPRPFCFCSRHIAIVVEVFDIEDVNPRPSSFCDIPIAYRIVNGYSNEANLISKKIDQLDGRQNQLRTAKGVPNDIAEQLFASHSKLCLISSSPIKSKKYVKSNKSKPCGKSHVGYVEEPCIQLFCREKRIIPVGEAHFPRSINSVPTDVLEGYPRMLAP